LPQTALKRTFAVVNRVLTVIVGKSVIPESGAVAEDTQAAPRLDRLSSICSRPRNPCQSGSDRPRLRHYAAVIVEKLNRARILRRGACTRLTSLLIC